MTRSAPLDRPTVDPRHLLIVGAGPGVGGSVARRFAEGGYHVTLLARSAAGVGNLAETYWRIAQSDGDWQSEFRFEGT